MSLDASDRTLRRSHVVSLFSGAAVAQLIPMRAGAQASKVTVGTVPTETNGQVFYAEDMGLFKQAGVDVELSYSNNLSVTMAALISGAIDITSNDMINLANAINRGAPLVVIAGGALYSSAHPATLLCVDRNSAINRAKDLEGLSVGVIKLGGISYTAVRAWLTQNGADITKIRFFELPAPEMTASLKRGTIAAAVFIEPELHEAANQVRPIGKPYDAMAKELLVNVWLTRRDWLEQNPDLAKRVVGALYAASRWANAHQDQSLGIIAKYAKLNLADLRGMVRERYATSLRTEWLQPVLDLAVQYKILDRSIDLSKVIATI